MKICFNENTSVSITEPLPAVHAHQPLLPLEPSTYLEGPIPTAPLVKPAGPLPCYPHFILEQLWFHIQKAQHGENRFVFCFK